MFGCGRDDSRQRDGTRMQEVDLRDAHAQQQQQQHHHHDHHHHHHQHQPPPPPPPTTTTTTNHHQPPPPPASASAAAAAPSLPPSLPPSTPAFVNAKHAQERPTNTKARPHRPPDNHLTVTISPFNGHISTPRGPCGWSQVPTRPRNCQHSQTRPYDPNQVGQPRASWCSARRTCM